MAFVSEIKYDGTGEAAHNEFIEITLSPSDIPADLTLGFYESNGTLRPGTSSFFPTAGEVTLQDVINAAGGTNNSATSTVGGLDLSVSPHPSNSDWLIMVIPASFASTGGTGNISAEAVALTNTATGTVISAYDIGGNNTLTSLTEGAASGATVTPTGAAENANNNNTARHWTINGTSSKAVPSAGSSVICLADGTLVQTMNGPRPVETLRMGDMLKTYDGGCRALRAIFDRPVSADACEGNPKLCPVKIAAGALGNGLPLRDLRVSRQHRMLIRSVVAQRMFGESEVLIPAQALVGFPGITMERARKDLRYLHLLMDRHELVLAEGAPTETLLLGSQSQEVIPPLILKQVLPLLPTPGPALGATEPARLIPSARKCRKLLARIRKNHHPLLDLPEPQALRA